MDMCRTQRQVHGYYGQVQDTEAGTWVLRIGAVHGGRYPGTTDRYRSRRQVHGYYVEVQNMEAGTWVL